MNRFMYLLLLIVFVSACSKDDDGGQQTQDFSNFTSQICPNIQGVRAVYWDYAHGLPTGLTQIPTIANPSGTFIHSQYPGLGFTIPQGYSANEIIIQETATLGVNVIRNDNQAIWRYLPTSTFFGDVGVNDILAFEINAMFEFLNFNGTPQVLCTTTQEGTIGGGFQNKFGARLLQFGDFTALVWSNTLYEPTLNTTFTSLSVSAAPTAEFDKEALEVFMAISFELLVINDGVRDSDADGFPDNVDRFPFDPTRN